jgi:2-keto-myo-inositol isomerase
MKVAYSGACAPGLPLEEELTLAASAGYDAIEIWLPKLWPDLERRGPEGLAHLLGRRRLHTVALTPITGVTFRDSAGRDKVTAEVHGAAQLARALGASWVVVQPGERPDGADDRDALREGRESLERLCRVGERYDVGVALMPLGFRWASLRTVRQTLSVIEAVGRRSLGWVLDTFHFHLCGASLDDLRTCRPRSLALLRLGDAPEGDRDELRDHHRLLPGTGIVPIRDIVGVLQVLDADPPVVVEARIPEPRADAAGWARRLRESALGVVRDPRLAPSR